MLVLRSRPCGRGWAARSMVSLKVSPWLSQSMRVCWSSRGRLRRRSSRRALARATAGVIWALASMRGEKLSFDGFVFVTAEYNHGIPGALKNAIDFLFREWNDKATGFVSYGGAGGARAVEQLRLVLAEVQMATVRNQVLLSMFTDFENYSIFKPDARHGKSVNEMFDQVIAWGGALKRCEKNEHTT